MNPAETWVHFDFDEFKADPSRLRINHASSSVIAEVKPIFGCVLVKWADGNVSLYRPHEFFDLALIAKPPRTVRVRLYRQAGMKAVLARTSDEYGRTSAINEVAGDRWVSEVVEIPVRE